MMHIVERPPVRVRPMTEADKAHPPLKMEEVIGEDGIRLLAEMEHGRWNVERLLRGWRHSETKDIAGKLNPCLVPWPALTNINGQDFQPYDLDAVRAAASDDVSVGGVGPADDALCHVGDPDTHAGVGVEIITQYLHNREAGGR